LIDQIELEFKGCEFLLDGREVKGGEVALKGAEEADDAGMFSVDGGRLLDEGQKFQMIEFNLAGLDVEGHQVTVSLLNFLNELSLDLCKLQLLHFVLLFKLFQLALQMLGVTIQFLDVFLQLLDLLLISCLGLGL
jgi:hypothetical protein